MRMTICLTALILATVPVSLPAAEDGVYELYAADIRLPLITQGFLAHRICATKCDYRRARIAPDALFEVNGRPTSYKKFREIFGSAGHRTDVTVLYDKENQRIRLLSIYVQDDDTIYVEDDD